MIRSFVAIDLPDSAKDSLRDLGEQLRSQTPTGAVRWVGIEGIHLTLKFLGNVVEADLPKIKAALAQVGQRHRAFTCTIEGAGCFPNTAKPRVVWVGLKEVTGALVAIQRDVERSLAPLGFEPEKRAFHAHLTLGRTRRGIHSRDQRRIGDVIASANVGELARIHVESFRLMRSELYPDGAVYTPLAIFSLGSEQEE